MTPQLLAVITGASIVGATLLLSHLLRVGQRWFRWWLSEQPPHFIGR